MEMNMRDWLIVIGVLLFLWVVLDGFRRAQRERKNQVRMSRKAEKLRFNEGEEIPLSELPNGGNKRLAHPHDDFYYNEDKNDPLFHNPFEELSAETADQESFAAEQEAESVISADELEQIIDAKPVDTADEPQEEAGLEESPVLQEPEPVAADVEVTPLFAAEQDAADDFIERGQETLENYGSHAETVEELLLMHVVPQATTSFEQADVFHILAECDLRLSPSSLFERFEQAEGQGAVQFSVANSTESGRFLVSNEGQELKGVALFMRLPGPESPIEAFEAMVAVARCLASNLQGTLKDELGSTMTEQTLQHNRQRIKDYLQRRLIRHG